MSNAPTARLIGFQDQCQAEKLFQYEVGCF